MAFVKKPRSGNTPKGYRLATVLEVEKDFDMVKERVLTSWDVVRLLDGWVTGSGWAYAPKIAGSAAPDLKMEHMLLVKITHSRGSIDELAVRKQLYSQIHLKAEGRKAALQLSLDDDNIDVLYWLLNTAKGEELENMIREIMTSFNAKAEPHTKDDLLQKWNSVDGKTLLHYAAMQNDQQVDDSGIAFAEFILGSSNDPVRLVRKGDRRGRTALHEASCRGCERMCALLLRYKAEVDAKDDVTGQTPLHFVVSESQKEGVVDMLVKQSFLQSREIFNVRDLNGKTALHIATEKGNLRMVRKLLDMGAQPLVEGDREPKSVLHCAAELKVEDNAIFIGQLLLERCTAPDQLVGALDDEGRTALHLAVASGHEDLFDFLLHQMENSEDGLHYASTGRETDRGSDYESYVEKILNSTDRDGQTALHMAATNGHAKMVKKLLNSISAANRKLYVSKPDFLSQTALCKASSKGDLETVRELLKSGAQPLAERDHDGKTALHCLLSSQAKGAASEIGKELFDAYESQGKKSLLLWASAVGTGTTEQSASAQSESSENFRSFLRGQKDKYKVHTKNLLQEAALIGDTRMTWELLNRGAHISDIERGCKWRKDLSEKDEQTVSEVIKRIAAISKRGHDQPASDDTLGRKGFAEGLAEFFSNGYLKSPITVGILGEWGMGKSSLMIQTEIMLLTTAAKAALPNLFQYDEFPGRKDSEWCSGGKEKYEKIEKSVLKWLTGTAEDFDRKNPLTYLIDINHYRPKYLDVLKSLARMERSEMFKTNAMGSMRAVPAILTVRYNAWHYRNEDQAWAGLAVEITKEMETTMTVAQKFRTRWIYAWKTERANLCVQLFIPFIVALFVAVWITWAAWSIVGRSHIKQISELKYGSATVTFLAFLWLMTNRIMAVVKPVSDRILGYMHLPDHTNRLGYQQKVISDICFLLKEMGKRPCWFWALLSGEYWWNWFFLCDNNVEDTNIPKMIPASNDDLRVIVFVDDLDRCQDAVILQVLSAINLVLAACKINVILGMDKGMIETAIAKSLVDMDNGMIQSAIAESSEGKNSPYNRAEKYLRKIIQLPLALPDLSDTDLRGFLDDEMGAFELEKPDGPERATEKPIMQDSNPSSPQNGEPKDHSCLWITECNDCFGGIRNHFARNKDKSQSATRQVGSRALIPTMPSYSEGERQAIHHLSQQVPNDLKLPRELKRFLNYHRLAWSILSKRKAVTKLPRWQVELVTWIFACWRWKTEMNMLISNWEEYVGAFSPQHDKNDEDAMQAAAERIGRGPSLLKLVENRIDECEEPKDKRMWEVMKQGLGRYDVSMNAILAFQDFRLYCDARNLHYG